MKKITLFGTILGTILGTVGLLTSCGNQPSSSSNTTLTP